MSVQTAVDSAGAARYAFDNGNPISLPRLHLLAEIWDPISQRFLRDVGVAPGWSCWEIGAGAGTLVRWLRSQVGEQGRVLATDLDPRFLEGLSADNVAVRRHDIAQDPLPPEQFDLIHARLVLCHVPGRERVLDQLILALKPGGWLVIEDFDGLGMLPDADVIKSETALASADAMRELMRRRGVNLRFGRHLVEHFRARSLQEIRGVASSHMIQPGSESASLLRLTLEQVRNEAIALGLTTPEQFASDLDVVEHSYLGPAPVMWSVAGRK